MPTNRWRLQDFLARGNSRLCPLVVVHRRDLFHPVSDARIHFDGLERSGISVAVPHRADARIRPSTGLPFGWRQDARHRAMAARRRGVCLTAATPGRAALEHRRRAAGECAFWFRFLLSSCSPSAGTFGWMTPNPLPSLAYFLHNLWWINIGLADFQPDAGLSARRRANFALAAVVSIWPREQFAGGEHHRVHRRRLADRCWRFLRNPSGSASWRRSF